MEYTVDYFIKKFEAIPSWRWTVGILTESVFGMFTRHCTLGHCNGSFGDLANPYSEANQLCRLVAKVLNVSVISINDSYEPEYQQKTPKERILAALYDIKAMQDKSKEVIVEKIVEKIVYVIVDEKVRELQEEELILN